MAGSLEAVRGADGPLMRFVNKMRGMTEAEEEAERRNGNDPDEEDD